MLRYTLTDRALRLRRGVMRVEEVTLSYVNIQNVKFVQGPLQRYFGIGDPELLIDEARTAAYSAIAISPELPEAQVAIDRMADFIENSELDPLPERYGWVE